jgi:hypothetical protein
MNKSILNMLNNEIECLNNEKLDLEKKLNSKLDLQTQCIIIEDSSDYDEENSNKHSSSRLLETIEECSNSESESYSGKMPANRDETSKVVENKSEDQNALPDCDDVHNNTILDLEKQIEEMSFRIDELNSELESEREKSKKLRNSQNDLSKSSETVADKNVNIFIDYLKKFKFQYLTDLNFESMLNRGAQSYTENNEIFKEFDELMIDFVRKYQLLLQEKDSCIKEKQERVDYFEKQLEKLIQNFKEENQALELKLNEKNFSYEELKNQVIFKKRTEFKAKWLS